MSIIYLNSPIPHYGRASNCCAWPIASRSTPLSSKRSVAGPQFLPLSPLPQAKQHGCSLPGLGGGLLPYSHAEGASMALMLFFFHVLAFSSSCLCVRSTRYQLITYFVSFLPGFFLDKRPLKMHVRYLLVASSLKLITSVLGRNIIDLPSNYETVPVVSKLQGPGATQNQLARDLGGERCGAGYGHCSNGNCCSTAGMYEQVRIKT